jgi:hypothetical protein
MRMIQSFSVMIADDPGSEQASLPAQHSLHDLHLRRVAEDQPLVAMLDNVIPAPRAFRLER